MGKLIPFLFIALDGKSAVAHLRLRIPGHKLRGSWFSFRWSPVRIVIGSHGLIATVFYFKNYATGIQRQHGMPGSCGHLQHRTGFPYNKNGNKLDFYGKMVGEHVWTTNGDTSSDDTTYARIGLKGETQINDQLIGYGQWEYNMDASNVEGSQTTKTRLAFAGLKAGEYGSFDYGRNYGAIYDVEAATDMLVEWGGDGWNYTDNYMTGRTNGVATYRNSDFFGLVDGLSFALQYQGKNDHDRAIRKQNGDGFSTAATYAFDNGIALSAGYSSSNRSVDQKADGNGDKAEAWATSAKYDANNIYAAVMYSQTYNMTPEEDNHFAGKTQNFEAVVQYQFDFGLRPSIGYVQTKGKDLQSRAGFSGGDADLVKYIEVGTWYYFNKNMNVYAAYKFNQLDDNDYTKAAGVATDDQAAVGIVYQF